jgi:hypothetical protein
MVPSSFVQAEDVKVEEDIKRRKDCKSVLI